MRNIKLPILFAFTFLIIISLSSGAILNSSLTGSNSETYNANMINLTGNFFNTKFNVTQIFTASNGRTVLWVPWYGSSSSCNVSDLKIDYVGTANMTVNSEVTDEFSEIGLLLALTPDSISATRFYYWSNTVISLNSSYGQLPCWVASRNGTSIYCSVTDTASDASTRIALAYYIASKNNYTSSGNASAYLQIASNLSRDHLNYEVWTQADKSGIPYGDGFIHYWASGGAEGIASQGNNSNPFVWTGYSHDFIASMLSAYNNTANSTYLTVANDYVAQYLLSVNYTGGTTASSFKVAPYNFAWNFTSTLPYILAGNTFYFNASNTQWDDSDAPRDLLICDTLRMANLTLGGQLSGSFLNLSNYCQAWSNTATYTSTTSCLQYYYNGSCSTSIRTGFYENGLGFGTSTYFNTSFIKPKVDETLTHYSWSDKTYDSAACYGVYRGVRPAYALATSLGFGESAFGDIVIPPIPTPEIPADICSSGVGAMLNLTLLLIAIGLPCLAYPKLKEKWDEGMGTKDMLIIFISITIYIPLVIILANLIAGVC